MNRTVGENIAELRQNRNLSIEELANLLRMDPSYLEQIEREAIEPAVSELMRIANALGTDVSSLIYGKKFLEKKAIPTRPAERVKVERRSDFIYESLAPHYSGKHMEPFLVEVEPHDPRHPLFTRHSGEEFHFVISGRLKIIVGRDKFTLKKGDSIYFDSSLSHALYALGKPVKLLSVLFNSESMLHLTNGKYMRDIIHAARHSGDKNMAVICPEKGEMEAVNKAIEEGVIKKAYLIGNITDLADAVLPFKRNYEFVPVNETESRYLEKAMEAGTDLIKSNKCHMIMKGLINTAFFMKGVLNRQKGIACGRRLSLISIFELPGINRLIFLTDPAINPALLVDNDINSSLDIINNAIDAARAFGVVHPRVALLEANENPSDKLPASMTEKQLAGLTWNDATVFGPLSYDLALYEESAQKKGLSGHPVAGKADILVVPYISAGNFLYKAWVMTMNAEVASIVAGAAAPLIITSRSDSMATKFLTICACAVYGEYLKIHRER
ncbi:MAG: cupin domain-containing protein [Spirochaetales bacterium]|nr:cupin domain-containing protein [Spirochaetales bacterium]